MCPSCLNAKFVVKALLGLVFCVPVFLLLMLSTILSVAIGMPVHFALKGAGCEFSMDPLDYVVDRANRFFNYWRNL